MKKSFLFTILGGLLWTGFHIWLVASEVNIRHNIRLIFYPALGTGFFFLALMSLYRAGNLRTAGKGSAAVLMIGLAIFNIGAFITAFLWNGAWLIAILGEMIISVGFIFFSFASLSEKFLARFHSLPLLMTLFYIPSWMAQPPSPPYPPSFEHWLAAVYGLGWILLGFLFPRGRGVKNG